MKVLISPVALKDMQFLKTHIGDDLQNPVAATTMLKKLLATIKNLPGPIATRMNLSDYIGFPTDYKFTVCATYIIFYKVEGETVTVYRVLYVRRDYTRTLFGRITIGDDLTLM